MNDFKTTINAMYAEWSESIQALWDAYVAPKIEHEVVLANWFTARPYVDEYNRGSTVEGFTYIDGRKVCEVTWDVGKPITTYIEPVTDRWG